MFASVSNNFTVVKLIHTSLASKTIALQKTINTSVCSYSAEFTLYTGRFLASSCSERGRLEKSSQEADEGMHRRGFWGQSVREAFGQLFILLTVGVMVVWVPAAPLLKREGNLKTKPSPKKVGEASGKTNLAGENPVFSLSNELLELDGQGGKLDPV